MEWKIGEIKQVNGEWYQCVEDPTNSCVNCCFYNRGHKQCSDEKIGECFEGRRNDKCGVCFKKLEKVGEPYRVYKHLVQKYRFFHSPAIRVQGTSIVEAIINSTNTIEIEIKQNKEDMEEKKLNLKPFDLEAAKAGKPVCTRDGRRVRIICFDLKNDDYPLVAVTERDNKGQEVVFHYTSTGYFHKTNEENKLDLMMLPEKKEGWVNVYYNRIDGITFSKHPYPSEKEAIKNAGTMSNRIDTVKISWEE